MAGFEDLGLSEALVANARAEGFETPTALQRSVIPVIRRGGNAVIRASSGAGITAAYTLGLLDRFANEAGTRALVIVPTADRAERVANTIARLAHDTPARPAALTTAWSPAESATVIVASAEKLMGAMQSSQLKLDDITAVVIDGAAATMKLAGDQALETILATIPRDAQRIIVTSEINDSVKKLAEAHAHKALFFPARPAVQEHAQESEPVMTLRYAVAERERKADVIARLARAGGSKITVICRSSAIAHHAARELRGRGFDVHASTYDGFDQAEVEGSLFAYDAPFSAEQITECFEPGAVIVCERSELPHLKTICADANVRLDAASLPVREADSLTAFREEIRRAAREEDLETQLLMLEPLFNEFSPEEVAAAACALLRARRPVKATAPSTKGDLKTWSRLFLSVGERDGVRAGDIVGAITGESGVRGDEVGKVEIRDTFSVVEVDSTAAERVIKALNGTTMKNRSLRVDYDRKTAASSARGPRGPGSGRPQSGNREHGNRPQGSGRPPSGGRSHSGGRPPAGRRPGPPRPSNRREP